MTISSIQRNINGVYNFVQVTCDNSISEITTPGYLTSDEVVQSINLANNGSFEFFFNDLILVIYNTSFGLFRYSSANCFNVISQGNSVLNYSPTISFANIGNLSVAYITQNGTYYIKGGKEISVNLTVGFTPTYTTSSGALNISLPAPNLRVVGNGITALTTNIVYPAGVTQIIPISVQQSSFINIRGIGNGTDVLFGTAQFLSGVTYQITLSIIYLMNI